MARGRRSVSAIGFSTGSGRKGGVHNATSGYVPGPGKNGGGAPGKPPGQPQLKGTPNRGAPSFKARYQKGERGAGAVHRRRLAQYQTPDAKARQAVAQSKRRASSSIDRASGEWQRSLGIQEIAPGYYAVSGTGKTPRRTR